jgi:hypothetical protein
MRSIDLRSYLELLSDKVIYQESKEIIGYLRDTDGKYHKISEVDLMRDRICCEDRYWDSFEGILEEKDRLFIETKEGK